MENAEYKKLVEAALFMSPKALGISELSEVTGVASPGIVREALEKLIEDYKSDGTSLEVIKISDKYMFGLKEPYASKVSSLASGPDLSRGALRILAYINKNNGILQSQIVRLFGSSTYEYMGELEEKDFIKTKKTGRSRSIETTVKFREYFNV